LLMLKRLKECRHMDLLENPELTTNGIEHLCRNTSDILLDTLYIPVKKPDHFASLLKSLSRIPKLNYLHIGIYNKGDNYQIPFDRAAAFNIVSRKIGVAVPTAKRTSFMALHRNLFSNAHQAAAHALYSRQIEPDPENIVEPAPYMWFRELVNLKRNPNYVIKEGPRKSDMPLQLAVKRTRNIEDIRSVSVIPHPPNNVPGLLSLQALKRRK
jgi:hypothetical protein